MLTFVKCIIWMVLAGIAEVPVVVSLFQFSFLIIQYSRQRFVGFLNSQLQR
jgi:hypothetical protein